MAELRDAVVVAYGRTACAKARKGSFRDLHPVDFGAQALRGLVDRMAGLDPGEIDDVIVGCAMPYGVQGWNVSRLILQRAGFPDRVTSQTVNRFCSSGLQTIALASNAIRCGEASIVAAGGVESMSMVPMALSPETFEPWLSKNRPEAYMDMGRTAENVAERYSVTREDMDRLALESHRRALAAWDLGRFEGQILPVVRREQDGSTRAVLRDEGMRADTSLESLSTLVPCFKEGGSVTAGNSSPMTDGASFLVLMDSRKAEELGLRPVARLLGYSTAGVPPEYMGIGPVEAVPKVLEKTGLRLEQMDVIELNEAFAAQAVACMRVLGMDTSVVNPWGGAIALGHPLGASGAVLACKALAFLEETRGRYGLVTMCVGGGMGAAGIFERL